MSAEVLPLPRRDPHIAGEAKCLACGHEWASVVAVGTVQLDCPECGLPKGVVKCFCGPADGEELWHCRCDCDLFYFTPRGAYCAICGRQQRFPA